MASTRGYAVEDTRILFRAARCGSWRSEIRRNDSRSSASLSIVGGGTAQFRYYARPEIVYSQSTLSSRGVRGVAEIDYVLLGTSRAAGVSECMYPVGSSVVRLFSPCQGSTLERVYSYFATRQDLKSILDDVRRT